MNIINLILIFLFVSFNCYSQTDQDSYLRWDKNRKLTLDDFKYNKKYIAGNTTIQPFAESYVDIYCEHYIKDKIFYYFVFAFFDMYSSYILDVVSKDGIGSTLIHEQGHFDICELYARKIREKFIENVKNVNNADSIINYFRMQENQMQEYYDENVSFGGDEYNQSIFNINIKKMLDSLKEYENPEGTVILK